MRKQKQRKFNAIIINKSVMISIAAFFFFIAAIFFTVFKSVNLSQNQLELILKYSIPTINATKKDSSYQFLKNLFDSFFNTKKVLAETIPILNSTPAEQDLYDVVEKSLKESKKQKNSVSTKTSDIPENTYPIGNSQIIARNLEVRNETTYQPDFDALLYAPLQFKNPEILIVHTHASESYKKDNLDYYVEGETDRNIDTQLNVVRVGTELKYELEKYGFKVTHAQDINDHPSYNKSYTKTLEVINNHLQANPNIQIVIDLHRDSVVRADGTKIKFTSTVKDENVAQVMLVCGTNQAGLDNDTWQENLKFAMKLQNYMEINFPGFARPLNLRQERFNMHTTKGSIIIEVGTSGNTLTEAIASAKYLAKTISDVLKPYM